MPSPAVYDLLYIMIRYVRGLRLDEFDENINGSIKDTEDNIYAEEPGIVESNDHDTQGLRNIKEEASNSHVSNATNVPVGLRAALASVRVRIHTLPDCGRCLSAALTIELVRCGGGACAFPTPSSRTLEISGWMWKNVVCHMLGKG